MTQSSRAVSPVEAKSQGMIRVGISEFVVSTGSTDVLVTFSLGSCIGVTFFDPVAHVGALIHCLLPLSKIDRDRAAEKPAMFVDAGVVKVLEALTKAGARLDRLVVKCAGGANTMDAANTFRIGQRNFTVLQKLLFKNNIVLAAEDVGGNVARTMRLYLADGRTLITKSSGEKELEL